MKDGFCEIGDSQIRFQPVDLEKTEGLGHTAPPLVLSKYQEDKRLCPFIYLRAYIQETSSLRTSDRLFVALRPPHDQVGAQTIAAWLKKVIYLSGQQGSGGSTRAVSSTLAIMKGASLQAVLAAGDWARVSTFKRFYYKPVIPFQDLVLKT